MVVELFTMVSEDDVLLLMDGLMDSFLTVLIQKSLHC